MRIRIDLSSLRRTKWHEYLSRFILGGAITVATGLIARYCGPVGGGSFFGISGYLSRERDVDREA
jgi:hypothetical protein